MKSLSLSLGRSLNEFTALRTQQALPMLKSVLEIYGFSCQLNMDNRRYTPKADMTFSTSKTNSEDNVDRARTALDYLQLRVPIPVPIYLQLAKMLTHGFAFLLGKSQYVIEVMNGTFTESIMVGYQKGGLCTEFNVHSTQFYAQMKLLNECLQELEQLTGYHIYNVAKRVLIVGTFQGAKVARKIVKDCIVHNVPPTPRIRDIMRINVATQKFGTLRL